ncbi:MAG: rhodanese-like domain-containing protein [Proteobacteria bacterium]|jgi:rhodanese-related sulfurtransferase|nr:rhodanese-like domain-containing protein [Pseudomonadota bacterium]
MRFSASHLWRISGRGVSCAPVLLVLALAVVLSGAPARTQEAEPEHVTASRAWDLAEQGGLVIVDVRTQGEWRQTGVAPGAARISLYSNWAVPNDDFVATVLQALGGDRDRPVALICATGGRSSYAANLLRREGFSHVADIGEGMVGSDAGIGWLSRALPIEDCGACPPL